MKKGYTHITMLIDKSGSMDSIKSATEEAVESFIRNQKKVAGYATLSLIQFDDKYDVDYWMRPLAHVSNEFNLHPRDMTAMFDAIATAIIDTGKALAALAEDERPETVIFAVMTDGQENASREFSQKSVRTMIKEQEQKYSWKFLFLGANQDAVLSAEKIGISSDSAITFGANAVGVRSVVEATSKVVTAMRTSVGNTTFTVDQRGEALGE